MSTAEERQPGAAAHSQQDVSLLDKIIAEGRMARTDDQRAVAKDLIGEFVEQVMKGEMKVSKDTQAMINARIGALDTLISRQLNAVMHHEEFQRLEASWRGLYWLVHQSETSTQLQIKVLNASKKDLLRDMERAPEFDQSGLFKKVYEEEFGVFGGEPFGVILGDYEFGNTSQDISLLEKVSNVAAAAHAPFLAAADSTLFGLDSFTQLGEPRDLEKKFAGPDFARWRAFRESEDSRYVGLALPHILMREPYGPTTRPVESFNFLEDVDGNDHSKYLWGNAAYALATRMTDSFAKYGWCANIRGVEGGGLVEGLPTHTFKTDEGDVALKCPTEIAITDRRERELSELGFIPLVHCKNTPKAAFFGAQSCQKAAKYNTDAANANARISTQLQYIMAISRFAHYLKSIMRDKVGSAMTRSQIEQFLNIWIAEYVTTDPEASMELKAQRPLSDARVDVAEIPGRPGCYKAVAYLKPHFQLDELTVSLRLVADLPQSLGG